MQEHAQTNNIDLTYTSIDVLECLQRAARRCSTSIVKAHVTPGDDNTSHVLGFEWGISSVSIKVWINNKGISFNAYKELDKKLNTFTLMEDEWLDASDKQKQLFIKSVMLSAIEVSTASALPEYAYLNLTDRTLDVAFSHEDVSIAYVIYGYLRTCGYLSRVVKRNVPEGYEYVVYYAPIEGCLSDNETMKSAFTITHDKQVNEYYLEKRGENPEVIDRRICVADFINTCLDL